MSKTWSECVVKEKVGGGNCNTFRPSAPINVNLFVLGLKCHSKYTFQITYLNSILLGCIYLKL